MRRARRVDHSLFIYFILTEEADGGGGSLLAYWTVLLLSPVLKQSMKLTQLFPTSRAFSLQPFDFVLSVQWLSPQSVMSYTSLFQFFFTECILFVCLHCLSPTEDKYGGLECGFVCTAACKPTVCLWLCAQSHHRYLSFCCLHQYELCEELCCKTVI